jgi:hypothetical protein
MKEAVESDDFLYQDVAASEIASRFGDEFTYINENGNLAIQQAVLRQFNKATPESVVWERGQRMWRKREDYDLPGRQQS